jgi:hypothetical protein
MKRNQKWATDHRALVLESVATSPAPATVDTIRRDAVSDDFPRAVVDSMIWQLRKEGLIARRDDSSYHVTQAGLDWLTTGRFDRPLPELGTPRPGARKPRGPRSRS